MNSKTHPTLITALDGSADAISVPPPYLRRIEALLASGSSQDERKILGLVGPPGSGKSTLAAALQAAFPQLTQVVPMDGFHLSNTELQRLQRHSRKGAPDTFDSAGYVALLQRLRQPYYEQGIVYAPEFRREIEEPIAGAIPIHAHTRLIITEGNYLLLNEGPWSNVASLLDEAWYVEVDEALRKARLIKRHEQFGRCHEAALKWVEETDEPNARRIESTRQAATLIFNWQE